MKRIFKKADFKNKGVNPWLIILLTAPIPFIVFGYFGYRWLVARTDFNRMAAQMVQRQNTVLAYDAMSVAKDVAHLLEGTARDVQALSLITPTQNNYLKFYLSRVSQVTQTNLRDESIETIPLPIYNEIIYINLQGNEVLRLKNGKEERHTRSLSSCQQSNLCDPALIQKALRSPVGELYYGSLMRWYVPEGGIEIEEGAHLPVVYRASEGVFILGIDYRYLKDFLLEPTFPYERRRDLLQSYKNGNYVYLVDSNFDFLAHPKYWHVAGIDRLSGTKAVPMKTDEDEGKHPLNVIAYQGERLRTYFERLRTRSFLQKSVDIFEASNLKGTTRVLSVAPVLLSKGQFQKSGVFGYIVIGCSVDYFEEPKEQYVPYY